MCLITRMFVVLESPKIKAGYAEGTFTLDCPLKTSDIQWTELVNQRHRDPLVIYTERYGFYQNHPNAANFKVDENHTLTISNLARSDTGEYTCRGRENSLTYEVNLCGKYHD